MDTSVSVFFAEQDTGDQKILLVDDTPANLEALGAMLERPGLRIVTAASGEQALRLMLEHQFALVLLDVQMPEMDGYEVARLMRATRRTRKVPILFVTAHWSDEKAVLRAYNVGAIDYLVKPFNPTILHAKVNVMLDLDRQAQALRRAYAQLDDQKAYYESILRAAGDGVLCFDTNGTIMFANPAACEQLRLSSEALIGQSFAVLYPGRPGEPCEWARTVFFRAWQQRCTLHVEEMEFCTTGRAGFPVSMVCSMIDGLYPGVVVLFQDMTERRALEEELRLQARTDHLTGLLNRVGLREALLGNLERARRLGRYLAVLFIDLDHFKHINDTLGHDYGDLLLQEVAERLRRSVRVSDEIARLGGDEFTVLLNDLEEFDEASRVATKILASLAEPYQIKSMALVVTASIGIAIAPVCGNDPGVLMQAADTAMYRAKGEGRNLYQFFTPEMNARAKVRLMLEQSLRHALDEGQLQMVYQPQVQLGTTRIVGFEGLLRWHHPEAGEVLPSTFVPLLEETGLIVPVGHWVLEACCRQFKAWREAGLVAPSCRIAINVSPRQFADATLIAVLRRVLSETRLPPACVELELTEGILLRDTDHNLQMFAQLMDLGVRLSLDDFGTGYSSMAYLKRFALNTLKIDKSFIDHLADDAKTHAIVHSTIELAERLGMETVAEGVETAAQLEHLRDLGCSIIQGYFYSPPLTPSAVETFMQRFVEEEAVFRR